MLMDKLDNVKLELAKEYIKNNKTTPALKLIKDLIFEINNLNINEQIEVLNKLLGANIKRKNYEYFYYRYINNKRNSQLNNKHKLTPVSKEKNAHSSSVPVSTKSKPKRKEANDEKSEVKSKKTKFDVEEYMNSNDGDNLFKKYNNF